MQYGKEQVRVAPSPCGLGVFSRRAFEPHDWVGPIEGTVVRDPHYESDYCMELGADWALEPAPPFRYVNHSCQPNCELIEVEVQVEYDDGVLEEPELWLEIRTDVSAGEQLTIDYGWPEKVSTVCRCGCPNCRGRIAAVRAP